MLGHRISKKINGCGGASAAQARRDRARVGRGSGHWGLDASSNGRLRQCDGDGNAVARAPPVPERTNGRLSRKRAQYKEGVQVKS